MTNLPIEKVAQDAAQGAIFNLVAKRVEMREAADLKWQEIEDNRLELRAEGDRIAKLLEQQTKPSSPEPRPLFGVNDRWGPEKIVSVSERKLYDDTVAWANRSAASAVYKILKNEYWSYEREDGGKGGYPGPAIHAYHMRSLQQHSHTLLARIFLYGDKEAWEELKAIWRRAIAMTATDYGELPVGKAERAREMAGIFKRWIYYETAEINGTSWNNTDEALLEQGLISGMVGEVNYGAQQNKNRSQDDREFAALMEDFFLNHLMRRRLYLNVFKYGSQKQRDLWASKKLDHKSYFECLDAYRDAKLEVDLTKWGHQLRHPLTGDFCSHFFCFKAYDRPEHKKAYEKLGGYLDADRHIIETKEWGTTLQQPHGNSGKCKELDWDFHDSSQDVTYVRESHPHELVCFWGESPFHQKDKLAALARTMHAYVLHDGPEASGVAATCGGWKPDRSLHAKRIVITREGTVYPSPLKLGGMSTGIKDFVKKGDLELRQQIDRGHSMILSHLTGEQKIRDDLDKLVKAAPEHNKAGKLAQLLFVAQRR